MRASHRALVAVAATFVVALESHAAIAQRETPERWKGIVAFEIGARIGYALPMGDIYGNGGDARVKTAMSDYVDGMIPLVGDLGMRVARAVFLGVYVGYGIVSVKGGGPSCPNGASCDGHDTRFGVEALYHVMPDGPVDPWLGIGFGYEWLSVHVEAGSANADGSLSGFEAVNLQLGLDLVPRADLGIGVGPFLMMTIAKFANYDRQQSGFRGASGSGDITDTATHQWLLIGVRGTFRVL